MKPTFRNEENIDVQLSIPVVHIDRSPGEARTKAPGLPELARSMEEVQLRSTSPCTFLIEESNGPGLLRALFRPRNRILLLLLQYIGSGVIYQHGRGKMRIQGVGEIQ